MRPAVVALCLQLLLAVAALGAGAAPGRVLLAYPVLTTDAAARPSSGSVALTCACVDAGINSPACFSGVTKWCQDSAAKPDMKVCAAMSGFINKQDFPSGMVVARFLIDTCKVKLPVSPSACACLEGYGTLACRSAALNACLVGNTLCPATVFGPEALADSQESFNQYVDRECGANAKLAARIDMNFTGVTKEQFQLNYAKGVAAALAQIVQVQASEVTASRIREVIFATGPAAGRRLAQAADGAREKVLLTTYQVRSAPQDAPTIQGRLQDAAANGNAGLYAALQANGVPLRPTFSFTGMKGDGGGSSGGGGGGGLSTGAIAGIAVGAAVGGLLLLAGIVYLVLRRRKSQPNPAYEANKGKTPAAAPVEVAAEEGAGPGGKAAGAAPAAVSDANGAGQPRDA